VLLARFVKPKQMVKERKNSLPASTDAAVDDIIAECGGDARAAIGELLAIIRSLIHENKTLRETTSPGYARRRPIVFGPSS
jgi:hypothetical protein